MLSISFLFEEVSKDLMTAEQQKDYVKQKLAALPRAKSPTAERDNYIKQRVTELRKMIGKKGIDSKTINAQVQDYLKKRYVSGMGVIQY